MVDEAGTDEREPVAVLAPSAAHPADDAWDQPVLDVQIAGMDLVGAPGPDEGGATAVIDHPEGTAVTVITVAGTVDAQPITRLVDMLAAQYMDGDVVVDLTPVMMTNPAATRALVAHLNAWAGTTRLRIVCGRLTARRLLRLWGGGDLPLCASLAGALGSLRMQTAQAPQPSGGSAAVPASR